MRILGLLGFSLGFAISLISAINAKSPISIVLFIIYFIFNGTVLLLFCVTQLILVVRRIKSYWPVGNILLGVMFFALSTTSLLFSNEICEFAVHYLDGVFISCTLSLLSVMMVYKYWDSITKEYLEFCVEKAPGLWSKEK
jgi:hypothetical protein